MNFAKTHNITAADNLKDIAKAVRADIKAAKKSGHLDGSLKVSVRTDYFSMGQALRVEITACDFAIANPARLAHEIEHGDNWYNVEMSEEAEARLNDYAAEQCARVDEIVAAYNWNKSDSQADYYNVNFYGGDCDYDSAIMNAERKAAATVEAPEVVEARQAEEKAPEVEEAMRRCAG